MYPNSNYTVDLRLDASSPSPVQWSLQGDGYKHLALEVTYKDGTYQRLRFDLDSSNSIECTVKQGEPKCYTIKAAVDAHYEWRNSDGSVFTGEGNVPIGYDLLPQLPQSTSLLYIGDNNNYLETYSALPQLIQSETPISP